MARSRTDLLQGTLDLLVLRILAVEPEHGWGIAQRIQQMSQELLQVNQGSLYPSLHRLEEQGLIASTWGTTGNNRQAKYYRLTKAGQRALAEETENWQRVSAAIQRILALNEPSRATPRGRPRARPRATPPPIAAPPR
jgi:PadR family transcriptional regulator, regulatory protein PadR